MEDSEVIQSNDTFLECIYSTIDNQLIGDFTYMSKLCRGLGKVFNEDFNCNNSLESMVWVKDVMDRNKVFENIVKLNSLVSTLVDRKMKVKNEENIKIASHFKPNEVDVNLKLLEYLNTKEEVIKTRELSLMERVVLSINYNSKYQWPKIACQEVVCDPMKGVGSKYHVLDLFIEDVDDNGYKILRVVRPEDKGTDRVKKYFVRDFAEKTERLKGWFKITSKEIDLYADSMQYINECSVSNVYVGSTNVMLTLGQFLHNLIFAKGHKDLRISLYHLGLFIRDKYLNGERVIPGNYMNSIFYEGREHCPICDKHCIPLTNVVKIKIGYLSINEHGERINGIVPYPMSVRSESNYLLFYEKHDFKGGFLSLMSWLDNVDLNCKLSAFFHVGASTEHPHLNIYDDNLISLSVRDFKLNKDVTIQVSHTTMSMLVSLLNLINRIIRSGGRSLILSSPICFMLPYRKYVNAILKDVLRNEHGGIILHALIWVMYMQACLNVPQSFMNILIKRIYGNDSSSIISFEDIWFIWQKHRFYANNDKLFRYVESTIMFNRSCPEYYGRILMVKRVFNIYMKYCYIRFTSNVIMCLENDIEYPEIDGSKFNYASELI